MSESLSLVSQNPGIAGFLLFLIVFLPMLRYVIKWAEKTTEENRKTYEYVLARSEKREEKLENFINTTLSDTNVSLTNINNNIDKLNDNVHILNAKVGSMERRLGGETC